MMISEVEIIIHVWWKLLYAKIGDVHHNVVPSIKEDADLFHFIDNNHIHNTHLKHAQLATFLLLLSENI